MIRHLAALTLLALLLSGCAKPPVAQYEHSGTGSVSEPMMMPATIAPAPTCQPGDDGIGGTGCKAE